MKMVYHYMFACIITHCVSPLKKFTCLEMTCLSPVGCSIMLHNVLFLKDLCAHCGKTESVTEKILKANFYDSFTILRYLKSIWKKEKCIKRGSLHTATIRQENQKKFRRVRIRRPNTFKSFSRILFPKAFFPCYRKKS